jgi:hypothetical protein
LENEKRQKAKEAEIKREEEEEYKQDKQLQGRCILLFSRISFSPAFQ